MALSKIRIGDYLELYSEKCNIPNLTVDDVSGINKEKEFFEPSKQVGSDTSNYKIVPPGYFACNLMHVGRDEVLPIAINKTDKNKIVSPAYTVFRLKDEETILAYYLFILVNSSEKDRYFWFHCDSSVRDGMEWNSFCDIELEIPSIDVQKKYVAIYKGLLENLKSYEKGTGDLKLLCDVFLDKLKLNFDSVKLSSIAKLSDERNEKLELENVYGLTVYKKFIETKANMDGVSLNNYKIVRQGDIAYVPTTNRNGDKIACGLAQFDCIVSSTYEVMKLNKDKVLPSYLFMWFARSNMDRYARYNSWGSARETIEWEDLGNYDIPLPDIAIQQAISNIFDSYEERKNYITLLKTKIFEICPILIRGAIKEAKGGN